MQNYGSIERPLTQLLKARVFRWNEEANASFEKLKLSMMTLPILAIPSFNLSFEIETNTSGYGVGVVLTQAKKPVAYFSITLSVKDGAQPVYERELIVVVFVGQRWRSYLLERKFLVKID